MNEFIIKAKLPTLNEYIEVERSNRFKASKLKKSTEALIAEFIRLGQRVGSLTPVHEPCEIIIEHHEENRRKDADNLQIRAKFILDSLKNNGIITNDSRKYVRNVYHTVHDAEKDHVRVLIVTAGKVKLIIEE